MKQTKKEFDVDAIGNPHHLCVLPLPMLEWSGAPDAVKQKHGSFQNTYWLCYWPATLDC